MARLRAPLSSLAAVAALLLASLDAAQGKPKAAAGEGENANFFRLTAHSFQQTLTYDNGLQHWLTSAATMPLRDRVQVMPPVPDRHGFFWNKKALETEDFEISVKFVASTSSLGAASPPGLATQDAYVALWLSPESLAAAYDEQAIVTVATKSWADGLNSQGLTFASNRPNFKGLGIFFFTADDKGKPSETVTGILNDGLKKWTLEELKRRPEREKGVEMKSTATSWIGSEVEVKVRVKPDGTIAGKLIKKGEEVDLFTFREVETITRHEKNERNYASEDEVPSRYFGVSGWSGMVAHMQLEIQEVETRNFDMTKSGEHLADAEYGDAAEWKQALEEEKRFVSQASQMQAIQRLTKLLADHVERYKSMGEAIQNDVAKIEGRLDDLGGEFGKLVAETEAFDFKSGTFNVDIVKDHIKGIGHILSQGKDQHDSKFAEVHGVAKDLKRKGGTVMGEVGKQKVQSVADQALILEEHAARGSTQTSFLLFLMVCSVAGLGLLFLNRMRYYEKKHYI